MRKETAGLVPLALLLTVVLPLQADGGVPDCFNPTGSLASTVRGPTAGDERFFTLPVGPSNIMFILDSSGSMAALPQCGDGSWGSGTDAPLCTYPLDAGTTVAGRVNFPAHGGSADVVGTCDVAGDSFLSWMAGYVPDATAGVFDPGHGTNSEGLADVPTWGSTCTGNNCLFAPGAIYHYNWSETSARQYPDCAFRGSNGSALGGYPALSATEAAACQTCLTQTGFYFLQAKLGDGSLHNQVVFSGAWLNKNPPKFMAARKVVKDMVWTDPATPSPLDSVRFGLAILASGGTARIVVPLGPDKPHTFPRDATAFREARQYMLDALNRTIAGLPSYMSGSTPMATTLFGVGQYLTSANVYSTSFGATFQNASIDQGMAGLVNAPWAQSNSNQCSICWGCQQNSIIIVTDGSPNSESTLPAAVLSYDQTTYTSPINCGPGTNCDTGATATCAAATNINATPVTGTNATGAASAVGTVSTAPSFNCTGTVAAGTRQCRCNNTGATADNPRIPIAQSCYTCPESGTKRYGGFTCSYSTCPGDATRYAANHVCYSTCAGDATQHPVGYVCGTTCAGDPAVHAAGFTCPCTCPGDPNSYTAGQSCPLSMCCSPSDSRTNPPSSLPRIASWLHSNDLRGDLSVANPQTAATYTISFGLPVPTPPAFNPAVQILKATANMSGGQFNNASDALSLATAVAAAVHNVVERANSFSAPAAASLSTLRSVAVEAVLTRFKPNDTPTWEGHVFQGQLFDEFLNGCDPTKAAGPLAQPSVRCGTKNVSANFDGSADTAGNATCTGVFLVDADCDEVAEDPRTGAFLKKGLGSTPANMFWDAGFTLSYPTYPTGSTNAGQPVPGYRSADARNILSVIDGAVTPFDRAHAAAFAPFLNLDATWCSQHLQLWGICGGASLPACSSVATQCATAIIDFVHGWDVTDNDGDGCGGPGRQGNAASCPGGADGEQRDRPNDARTASPVFWKLGDIFHSAPVLVRPPPDEFSCGTGFDNQCTATIFSPAAFPRPTSIVKTYAGLPGAGNTADAYEAYRLAHVDRRRVVLVGANDGMVHAFDAGSPDTAALPNALGVHPYSHGNGEELWALVPPDLLPRLKDLTLAHQYMVDGNIMVKEVWVDGSTADPAVNHAHDNVKQYETGSEEFHTVAVITERTGGTQYTALDVTDVEHPKFLWNFPPPGSDDSRYMGQSWSDFAPGPPPIGPIRLALGSGVPDPTGRGFEEQWIVMANGGYDPTLTRGRAVWMLDVWTGRVVWRFTDDDFKAQMGFGSGVSMFPVVGTVGAVDIGDAAQASQDRDGYFDTATWGDLGGNLFVARFWQPGQGYDATHRVSNWFAARGFEQQRRANDAQNVAGRVPFFFMPDNVFDSTTHTLRSFLGSGNRERSMTSGNECNPDNLLGCCAAGCDRVEVSFSDAYGTCSRGGTFRCSAGLLELDATTSSCGAPLACGTFTTTATLHLECPGAAAVDITGQMTCDAAGLCTTPTNLGTTDVGTMPSPTTKARFYGVWSFGGSPAKSFDTLAQAVAFDANRFTDVAFAGCTGPAGGSCQLVDVTQASVTYNPASPLLTSVSCLSGSTCQASSANAGWFYQFGEVCPLSSCDPAPPWFDEKTGAPSSTVLGCTSWGSFRPVGATASGNDPCTGSSGTPQTYGYLADYLSGVPTAACGYQFTSASANAYVRATQRNTIAAPNAQTIRVVVSPSGEVKYQGLEFPPGSGSGGMVTQTNYGTRTDTSEMMYWLEVPRDLHDCRHNPAAAATTCE